MRVYSWLDKVEYIWRSALSHLRITMQSKLCRLSNGRRMLEQEARTVVKDNAVAFRKMASHCDESRRLQAERKTAMLDLQEQQKMKATELTSRLDYEAALKRGGMTRGHTIEISDAPVMSNRLEADVKAGFANHVCKKKDTLPINPI